MHTYIHTYAGEKESFDMIYDTVSSPFPGDKQYEEEVMPFLKKDGR